MTQPDAPSLEAFTADVEDYFQVEALRSLCPRSRWGEFEDRTVASTRRLLRLLDRHGVRGTFFVLGWVAARHPELVGEITQCGHEIASHGFDHELVYNQTPEAFRSDVQRARRLLQDLSGQEVVGYRAPSYTIVARTRWALAILSEEGYEYDSSVFPIRRRRYGMPDAPRFPHRIDLGSGRSLAEFPLPTVRCGPLNFPATGGAYLRLLPLGWQSWALGAIRRQRRPHVLTIHPWELDAAQPRLPVGLRTRWTHYHNLGATERRLARLLERGSYRPMRDVLQTLGLLGARPLGVHGIK